MQDFFLKSLAIDRLQNSIGVILSGMGSDGSQGLKSIKENDGIVLVQEPKSAKFDPMPLSALQAVIADVVAPATELPEKLLAILKLVPVSDAPKAIDEKSKIHLDKIIILLREQSGHDFSFYKKNTLIRRIERRKGIHQIEKISAYVRFLQENPAEVNMQLLIQNAQINILPSFNKTGVKLKLLNALYNGRHCIVNEAGIEGSGLKNLCFIEENADGFIEKINELFTIPFTAKEMQYRSTALKKLYNNNQNGLIISGMIQ